MTEHAPDAGNGQRRQLVVVPDGHGGERHEWRPVVEKKGKKKKARLTPEAIEANPDYAAQQLKNFIERKEGLLDSRQDINDEIREVNSEMKAVGFDVKTLDAIIRLRKMRPDDRMEAEVLLETYKSSLGIA